MSKLRADASYPLQQIPGFLCEVGRQAEFTLQDLVDGLFPVFAGERRLDRKRLHKIARFRFDKSTLRAGFFHMANV